MNKKIIILTKILTLTLLLFVNNFLYAQDSTFTKKSDQHNSKTNHRNKINALIKQSEEGTLAFSKQHIFGFQLRSNGSGILYEHAIMKTIRISNLYRIDINEIKSTKEYSTGFSFFNSPYIYGKLNNFYSTTLGAGKQYILGQKGNKNGIAVSALGFGGLALGLLRPYYVQINDSTGNNRFIKYYSKDSLLFLDKSAVRGGGGLSHGWGEIKIKPGLFAKAALRFDYGRFNDIISAIEIGTCVEFYFEKIPLIYSVPQKKLFFQAYAAIELGRRKLK